MRLSERNIGALIGSRLEEDDATAGVRRKDTDFETPEAPKDRAKALSNGPSGLLSSMSQFITGSSASPRKRGRVTSASCAEGGGVHACDRVAARFSLYLGLFLAD